MECPIKKLCNELKATNNWISVVRFRRLKKSPRCALPLADAATAVWRNREQPIRFVAAKFPTETTFDDASDGKEAKINRKRNRNEKRRQDRLIHYLFEVWIKSNSTQN